jgi:hypothetical protein
MLAAMLLSNPSRFEIILPNFFVSEDKELSAVLQSFWSQPDLNRVEKHGGSFWFRVN